MRVSSVLGVNNYSNQNVSNMVRNPLVTKDEVSFGNGYQTCSGVRKLKSLVNIPCVYCGKKMIPSSLMDDLKFSNTPYPMNTKQYTHHIVSLIEPYKDSLMTIEKQVFEKIQNFHSKFPNLSLQDMMNILRKKALPSLVNDELSAINNAKNTAKLVLNGETKSSVLAVLDNNTRFLTNEKVASNFKRKNLIKDLNRISCNESEKKAINIVLNDISKMPKSSEDVRAFIVKYSNKEKINSLSPQTIQRSNEEIAQRLISPSLTSVEHIRPQVVFETNNEGGRNQMSNLVLAHSLCNSERSAIPLNRVVEKDKGIIKYIQNYIDFIKNSIFNKTLKNMDSYPADLQKTFYKESKGKINITV